VGSVAGNVFRSSGALRPALRLSSASQVSPRRAFLKSNPIWTSTKRRTSVQNAFLHWKEHGTDFPEFLNAKQYTESDLAPFSRPVLVRGSG
jgi:pyocin large subunit-like protein